MQRKCTQRRSKDHMNESIRKLVVKALVSIAIVLAFGFFTPMVSASAPGATIEYQPMTSYGLAAGYPFEAWVVFDKPADPTAPGYALPAGATFRFTFPEAFTPQPAGPRTRGRPSLWLAAGSRLYTIYGRARPQRPARDRS